MSVIPFLYKAVNAAGAPLVGGKLHTFESDGVTPKATYTDTTGTTLAANPLILNGFGQVLVYANPGTLYVNLTDSLDAQMPYYPASFTVPSVLGQSGLTGLSGGSGVFAVQNITATAGQTVFNLDTGYVTNANNIVVYINGVRQISGVDYAETDINTITMTVGANLNDIISVASAQGLSDPSGVAAAAQLRSDLADTILVTNGDALIGVKRTNGIATNQHKVNEGLSLNLVTDFGADPTGVTSSQVALVNFFAASTGKLCLIPAGTFKITAELQLALTNCVIQGVPGQTKLTGNFDYAIIQLLALSNVQFRDIIFESTYTNAVENGVETVVYSIQNNAYNVVFSHCEFTAPNCNTGGLNFLPRVNRTDNAHTVDGLWVEDCYFHDMGRIPMTLMNRGFVADRYTAFRRVYLNRNKAVNTGTMAAYGFLVSFDHYGSDFQCDWNEGWNVKGALIENTGWINGSISYNKLMSAASDGRLLSLDGTDSENAGVFTIGDTYIITTVGDTNWVAIGAASNTLGVEFVATGVGSGTGVALHPMWIDNNTIIGNQCLVPSNSHVNINYVRKSYFANNLFWSNTSDQAVLMRGCTNNRFSKEIYLNSSVTNGRYAILIDGSEVVTTNNIWDGSCIFDSSASTVGFAIVRFYGAFCTGNTVQTGAQLKRGSSGTFMDEIVGATLNYVEDIPKVWSPRITGAAYPANYNTAASTGTYTKVGKQIRFQGRVTLTAKTGISGNVYITGLPFAENGDMTWGETCFVQTSGITLGGSNTYVYGTISPSTSQIVLVADGSPAGGANVTDGWLSTTPTIVVTGTYMTA